MGPVVSNDDQFTQSGRIDPLDARRARPIASEGKPFFPGIAFDNVDPSTILSPIAGAVVVRIRGRITTTEAGPPAPLGVLSFEYRRNPPNQSQAYDTALDGPATDVTVLHDTEFEVEIEPRGEPLLAVTFTPDAGVDPGETITPTFFDIMQL
jgi:hypothetical protein